MAQAPVRKSRGRIDQGSRKDPIRCHCRHSSIFLIAVCSIMVTILAMSVTLSSQPVAASSGTGDSIGGGYECTFYVREGIGYGVILSYASNTSSSSLTSDVKFTFTYNASLPDVASRLSIYSYSSSLYVTKLNASSVLTVEYDGGSPAYYAVKSAESDLCRAFVQEGSVTPSGEEYRKVVVSTKDDAGWSSGYYVGQGATVVFLSGAGGGDGNSGEAVTGWNLASVGNAAIAVAITISSLIPFFIVLPDAAKTLSDNIVAKRGRKSDGGDLYLSILSVFVPLLCMCVAVVSTIVMLGVLHQPMG